jgi:hypothetical protein
MILARATFAALALLGLIGPAAAAEFWLKAWTVAAIEGAAEQRQALAGAIGQKIVLSERQIVDPLSRDCEAGVDLSDIRLRPVGELAGHFGALWTWPKFAEKEEIFGWARCEGSNIGAFAFVGPQQGYLFYEDGVIVELR